MAYPGEIKIMIVDDESEVRKLLSIMLRTVGDIKICGEASGVDEAIALARICEPDLVLLDIQMPDKDGFTFLEELRSFGIYPAIIFVTAYENYAIKAIKNAAFDYLTKPISKEELFSALNRFRESKKRNYSSDIHELSRLLKQSKLERIRLNTRAGYFFVDPDDIIFIKADGNYSHIMLPNDKIEVITQSLGSMEDVLKNYNFFRVSRSYIINMKYISKVDRRKGLVELESSDLAYSIKIPNGKVRILEEYF